MSLSAHATPRAARTYAGNPDAFKKAVDHAVQRKVAYAIKAGILRFSCPGAAEREFVPRMDLIDDPSSSNMVAIFELPGVKTSDISLHIRDGHLLVLGRRRCPNDAILPNPVPALGLTGVPSVPKDGSNNMDCDGDSPKAVRTIHELRYGTFARSIQVPAGIKESEISAGLQDGMLTVTWPRSADSNTASTGATTVSMQRDARMDNMTPPPSLITAAPATAQ